MAFNKRNIRFAFNKSNICHSTFRRVLFVILVCLLVNGLLFASILQRSRIEEIIETLHSSHHNDFVIGHEQETEEKRGATATEKPIWEEEVGSPAWLLVEETREAVRAAGGVPRSVLSPDERKVWNEAHPCEGREELLRLWVREKKSTPVSVTNNTKNPSSRSEPSPLLHVLFQEYANLHRTCTHGGDMAYVTEFYKSGNESSSPCKFLVAEFGLYGIGNRLLWLVSAFQYALLTTRVLLIDTRSTVDNLLCDPFPGSSWQLPDNFPYSSSEKKWPMPSDFQAEWDQWENRNRGLIGRNEILNGEKKVEHNTGLRSLDVNGIEREKRETMAAIRAWIENKAYPERLSNMDKETIQNSMSDVQRRLTAEEDTGSSPRPYFHHAQANDGWAPNRRFFCENEQDHLHRVKWVSLSKGCLYFLPDLFAVRSFQPALEELFPNRDPLTHLLRQLTLPVDSIWKKVQDLYNKEFKSASRVVGMQVRYRNGAAMYRNLNPLVNKRISQCGSDNGLIPDPAAAQSSISRSSWSSSWNHDGPVLIFIASLYQGLNDHLESFYDKTLKKGRKNSPVKLLQLSNHGFQSFDLEADHQAFLEIICLSLGDELLTSPQSTYGQMAQALGALTPWLVDFSVEDNNSTCVRGQSTDACYQLPIDKFTCPFNKEVDEKQMAELAPYLKTCQDMTDGLQLVPPWSPSLLLP